MNNASPMPVRFTRHNAVSAVKQMYGDVESFVLAIAEQFPEYLNGDSISPEVIAHHLGIPEFAFTQVINSNAYQTALDALAASQTYNLQARIRSMHEIAKVATGSQKLIMSPKGDPVYVDRDVNEMIAADKHLRNLQGRPLETSKGNSPGGITIQFGDITNEETHQHLHVTQGNRGTIEPTNNPPGDPPRIDWNTDRHNPDERTETHAPLHGTTKPEIPEARSDERQPHPNTKQTPRHPNMGEPARTPRESPAHNNETPHDTPYQPPQPGSGPPTGQARAYTRRSPSHAFQSHDAEITDGPPPTTSSPTNKQTTANMDKAERLRKIGFGLHQTTPQASEERQTQGTDETPTGTFHDLLGGDTPITPIPQNQQGEEAIETIERRARLYRSNKEESLHRYLNQKPLVEPNDDD